MAKKSSVEDLMSQAFKKLDERLRNEKEEAQRAVEAEKFRIRHAEALRKQKQEALTVYSLLGLFLVFMSFIIYNANQNGYFDKLSYIARKFLSSSNIDCTSSTDWNKEICVQQRQQQLDANWRNMFLNKNAKERPFAIHKESKD